MAVAGGPSGDALIHAGILLLTQLCQYRSYLEAWRMALHTYHLTLWHQNHGTPAHVQYVLSHHVLRT